jgi:hypothetical protein
MSFLIDFWPLNTIPLQFWRKKQDGGDIRVGQKFFFYLKNSKSEIFQKVLPRFWPFLKIFRKGGTIQDGGFLIFIFKNLAKINELFFSILFSTIFIVDFDLIHIFWKKLMFREKIKMAAKNQNGVRWTIFSTEIQLKRHLATL